MGFAWKTGYFYSILMTDEFGEINNDFSFVYDVHLIVIVFRTL
jgi:hypothetical protein